MNNTQLFVVLGVGLPFLFAFAWIAAAFIKALWSRYRARREYRRTMRALQKRYPMTRQGRRRFGRDAAWGISPRMRKRYPRRDRRRFQRELGHSQGFSREHKEVHDSI